MSKPVVCHLVLSLGVGGTERLVCEMCRDLTSEFEVLVCCLDEPGIWGRKLRREGIPVYALYRSPGIDLSVVFALARLLKKQKVNLIHAHQYSPFFYGALARLLIPAVKLLFMEHGRHWPEVKKPLKNLINRFFFQRLAHEMVAVSREVRERLVLYEGLSRQKIRVIYNGIKDIPRLSTEERQHLRKKWGFRKEDFVVTTVGRFDPIKNLPMLLQALAIARGQNGCLRAFLIGDGPEREKLETLVGILGLEGEVVFTGFREDAVRLIQAADCFVLSSFSEGTSLALLEAMAAGLPCVVTDVGGNPEVVADSETGFVVPSRDVVKMAAAFSLLAEKRDLARKMGEAARKRFKSHFTFAKMMQEYRSLYRRMGVANGERQMASGE